MKRWILLLFLLTANVFYGQENFYNEGNLRIFSEGQIGFHGPIRNDGSFDQNRGLAGLYGQNDHQLSGKQEIAFWDLEIFTPASWALRTTLKVRNNLNFIEGNLFTPPSSPEISLEFMEDAFYTGDSESSKVAGFISVAGVSQFRFPVGDAVSLRPVSLFSETNSESIRAGYFRANPTSIGPANSLLPVSGISSGLLTISSYECWKISGGSPAIIRLTWDQNSRLESLVQSTEELTIAGWHTANNRWENLGKTAISGNIQEGKISSVTYIPDHYSVVTFGKAVPSSGVATNNYLLSPNNDGFNDYLIFPGLENTTGNGLQIFNRYGILVYSNDNYTNDFSGYSNSGRVTKSNTGLAAGIYYYLLTLSGSDTKKQGYLYLSK